MKKYFCVLSFVILCSRLCNAQEAILQSWTPNDYQLTDKQYSAWKSIQNNWVATEYEAIMAENKIKLNCASCGAFYIEVAVKIGVNGKFEGYELVSGKRCGVGLTREMELRMMRKFYKFEYPFELRGLTFKTRLGSVLKC